MHTDIRRKLYVVWQNIKGRCYNKCRADYKYYGGRGILLCKRWQSFETFYDDLIGTYRPGLTLDRINNNKNYSPANTRWITRKEQGRNKRNNKIVRYKGNYYCLVELCEELGLRYYTMQNRLKLGWSIEKAAHTPTMTNLYKYKNRHYSMQQLSDLTGVNYSTLRWRLKSGWNVNKAIVTV